MSQDKRRAAAPRPACLDDPILGPLLGDLAGALARRFDVEVSASGPFRDVGEGSPYAFPAQGASRSQRAERQRTGQADADGRIDFVVMAMDPRIDPAYATVRFLSIRVRKSPDGGTASLTDYHGTSAQLKARLVSLSENPTPLAVHVSELADGLPEITSADIWR